MQIAQQETWIRERAYAIWEQEGRPAGRDHQHWYQAACEIGESAGFGQAAAAPKPSSAKRRMRSRKADA
jgi:hypothetical protein